jgi:hypothetical protein
MTTQLWLTAIVAIIGNITTVTSGLASGALTGRNAMRLAQRTRDGDRRDARYDRYEDACVQFFSASRILRSPQGAESADREEILSELRRAVTRIELYGPESSAAVVANALEHLEDLVRIRAGQARSFEVAEAEKRCDETIAAARRRLSADLEAGG